MREEHEVRIRNTRMLKPNYSRLLGLRPWFPLREVPHDVRLPGIKDVELDVDETPVGDYLELEGARGGDRSRGARGWALASAIHHQELWRAVYGSAAAWGAG